MKALIVSLALLAAAPLSAHAQTAPEAAAKSPDVVALEALNAQWLTAYKTRDAAALDRILGDDFQGIYPNGRIMTKGDVLKLATNPARTIEAVSWEDVKIVVIGDVAVLRARTRMSGKGADGPFASLNDFADVYVKRGGAWKAISAHVVRVE
ncbi:nuclear transport factor 2 family protein [Caulobacter sp. RL271]|uniref:Nuclear transport factor 2 family protein n=1 Tax=Caulobacter segnis TaxID=88688 RepID=A0ABY5A068_9CAUL|nr:nuclear transport factor 2 family protein [Caulobacter segnis]USQ98373.1 nuclear transport factor 2 family protein [Caulobacter segnis]